MPNAAMAISRAGTPVLTRFHLPLTILSAQGPERSTGSTRREAVRPITLVVPLLARGFQGAAIDHAPGAQELTVRRRTRDVSR